MATNWPTSRDTFTNPTSGDTLDSPSHAAQHANINDAVEAMQLYAGLVLVAGGTVSGATVLSVDNCFTSQFDNYRLTFRSMRVSIAARAFRFRMRAGGSDATTNYDYAYRGLKSNNTGNDTAASGSTFTEIGVYIDTYANSELGSSTIDLMGPALAERTFGEVVANGWEGAFFARAGSFGHFTQSAYDGFTVYLSSTGNMSFDWRVYGYNDG